MNPEVYTNPKPCARGTWHVGTSEGYHLILNHHINQLNLGHAIASFSDTLLPAEVELATRPALLTLTNQYFLSPDHPRSLAVCISARHHCYRRQHYSQRSACTSVRACACVEILHPCACIARHR